MSDTTKIVMFFCANLFHSNVSAKNRRWMIENFDKILNVLGDFSIPILMSIQAVDLKILSRHARPRSEWPKNIKLTYAPYNHASFPILGLSQKDATQKHIWDMLRNGVVGDVPILFMPEFAYPLDGLELKKDLLVPVRWGDQTLPYQTIGGGDVEINMEAETTAAFRTRGTTLVPMRGFEAMERAFFEWQRFPDGKHKDGMRYKERLMRAIMEFCKSGKHPYGFFPMDLEACLVGSHHGLNILTRLGNLLRDMTPYFADPMEATNWLIKNRIEVPDDKGLTARTLGKWMSMEAHMEWIFQLWDLDQFDTDNWQALALATGSDYLSALSSKLSRPFVLAADKGPITIGYDQTILDLGERVYYGVLTPPAGDDDGSWFIQEALKAID